MINIIHLSIYNFSLKTTHIIMIISIIKAIYFNQYSIIYTAEVTSLCWRPFLNVGDKKVCWWHFSARWWHSNGSPTSLYARMWCWRLTLDVGDVTSPTSQTCHQHIWSPTSVTNIDVHGQFRTLVKTLRPNP